MVGEAQGQQGRGEGGNTCMDSRCIPVHPYLLGLSEKASGAAVVDVYFAQALERSSHGNVWGRGKEMVTWVLEGSQLLLPVLQPDTDLALPGSIPSNPGRQRKQNAFTTTPNTLAQSLHFFIAKEERQRQDLVLAGSLPKFPAGGAGPGGRLKLETVCVSHAGGRDPST